MTPTQYYEHFLANKMIHSDPQQKEVIELLQSIYDQLQKTTNQQENSWQKLTRRFKKVAPVKGLYLWGGVGIGKTLLMDIFYNCLSVKKMRLHFHEFMLTIHQELRSIQGVSNPLQHIGEKLAQQTQVICFDEFFVSNIADAMILAELFAALFANGITLIASSNVRPDDLYKEGLQRERFLPAIELIKKYTHEYHMVSHHDYRLDHFTQDGVYFSPLGHSTHQTLEKIFERLAQGKKISDSDIQLLGRTIPILKRADNVIWFDFPNIVGPPRSQYDYLALAKQYNTIMISNIPVIKKHQTNLVVSFINLIDVFYDAGTRLVVSAEKDIENLYPQGQMRFEFARTQSRINEMQSLDYFTRGKQDDKLRD